MQIYCRQCGKEIQAGDINLDTMIAKCSACNAVFSFADMYEGHTHKKKKQLTYDMPMPYGFTVQDNDTSLMIERKWFSLVHIFLAVFAVIWNGMIWFIFVPSFFSTAGGGFTLFLLPFIAVGIGLIYIAIAGFLNTTTIQVDNTSMTIRHQPLPFPGKDVASSDIEQLFTKQRIKRNKNSVSVTYQLRVLLSDGREQTLLQSLNNAEQALFIEQEVERFLEIENIPVSGEYRS